MEQKLKVPVDARTNKEFKVLLQEQLELDNCFQDEKFKLVLEILRENYAAIQQSNYMKEKASDQLQRIPVFLNMNKMLLSSLDSELKYEKLAMIITAMS